MATVSFWVDATEHKPFGTAPPEPIQEDGTNRPHSGLAFDASTAESAYFQVKFKSYGSGNVTIKPQWYADSATANDTRWGASIGALTPGDSQSWLTDGFGSQATVDSTASGTTNGVVEDSITVTSLDSVSADDLVWIEVERVAAHANDDMTGDAVLIGFDVEYSDT